MTRPNRSRLLAPLFALLLVFSAFAGGVGVQPAAATHDCSNLDSLVFFASLTIANYDKCAMDHTTSDVDAVRDATTNQTKSDIYNAALASEAQSEVTGTVFDNHLNDTESVAWMKAESALADAYRNGSSQAVARAEAKQAIADYYATMQVNLIESWNVSATEAVALRQRAINESDIGKYYIHLHLPSDDRTGVYEFSNDMASTRTLTLANGSTHQTVTLRFGDGDSDYEVSADASTGRVDPRGTTDTTWATGLEVFAPNTNFEEHVFMDFEKYGDRWTRIENKNTNLQAQVDPFVNETWTAYEAGTINATDVLNANTQMFEYGTDYDGNTTLYNTVAALSAMGLDTPNLNGTGTMAVTYNNIEYHGLVMAREAPNGSWSANTTYNASTIDGPVFIVTTDGKKIDVTGEFRISSISATDGSNIETISATKVVYKTANTSELLDKIERVEQLRQELEAKEQAAADSGSGSGTNIDPKYLLGALAVVGLLAYGQGQKRKD